MEALFIKGALLGFAMAAPVGPVGLLTIRTSIQRGRLPGMIMAAGVAMADAMYGAVAAFGLTVISDPIMYYRYHIQFFGGGVLLALAVYIFLSKVKKLQQVRLKKSSKLKIFTGTVLFTLSNPSNIFTFAAAFTVFDMATHSTTSFEASLIVLGVFLGSGGWFALLSWMSSRYQSFFNDKIMKRVNQGAGIALALFACYAVFHGYHGLNAHY